jgi:hypothetical protein
LLEEEMRRGIQFCAWKSNWWREQVHRRTLLSPHLAEGLTAYAIEQVAAEHQRIISWSNSWEAIRRRAGAVLQSSSTDQDDMAGIDALEIEIEEDDEDEDVIFDADDM